ncbi:MAG TPA: phosphopantetheine-binding protein, partial [Hyphomicrobiaceae bacterium]|nr:phosphopantetheine-binding protein [Hyphomicrobiaceae bacterium]
RGKSENELTKFRYQVLIHVGPLVHSTSSAILRRDWREKEITGTDIRHLLLRNPPGVMAITNIANARLRRERALLGWLGSGGGPETVGEQRAALDRAPLGVDPEDLWAIGRDLPYRVSVSWSQHGSDGSCDVLFSAATEAQLGEAATERAGLKPLSACANNPLQKQAANALVQSVRQLLKQRLPDYMVPSAFVVLETLPRLPNGKVDRKALPKPDGIRWDLPAAYLAPQTDTEQRIARIWQEALQLERVGSRDNFFDLGGHSLLLIQVRNKLQEVFARTISTTTLLEYPTVGGLAAYLTQRQTETPSLADSQARAKIRKDLARQQRERRRQEVIVTGSNE